MSRVPKLIDVEARRRELAEALWSVVIDDGLQAVSVRSVAARAGVSTGSLRHVFPTRSDLVTYSAELIIARATERVLAHGSDDDSLPDALAILCELLPLTPESRTEGEVNTALIAEATREPGLHEIRDRMYDAIGSLCRLIVTDFALEESPHTDARAADGGTGDPELDRAAKRLHALVDGIALHLLHQPPGADTGWATDLLADELRSLGVSRSGRRD